MSDKKKPNLVPVLLPVALLVWGWNIFQFVVPSTAETLSEKALPEIPAELVEDILASGLPDLSRDPFLPPGTEKPEAVKPAEPSKPKPEPIAPPPGRLSLIIKDNETYQARFELPDGTSPILKKGDLLGEWEIVTITFEQVDLKHPKGGTQSLRIF